MKEIKWNLKVVLVVIICLTCLLGGILVETLTQTQEPFNPEVREINANELSSVTIKTQAQKMINQFTSYDCDATENSINFNGEVNVDWGKLKGFDYLSTEDKSKLKKNISASYDFETGIFYVRVKYTDESGEIIEEITESVEPEYDEVNDDVYFYYEGEKYSMTALLETEAMDNCVSGTLVAGSAAVALAGVFLVSVVASDPTIVQSTIIVFEKVVNVIVEKVKAVFGWFARLFTRTKTETTYVPRTKIVYEKTPSVEINGVKYITEYVPPAQLKNKSSSVYYIAFADTTTGKMYLSTQSITEQVAIEIMKKPVAVPCMANSKFQMIVSVFSIYEKKARHIAQVAGGDVTVPDIHSPVRHYHSNKEIEIMTSRDGGKMEKRRPHAFFAI